MELNDPIALLADQTGDGAANLRGSEKAVLFAVSKMYCPTLAIA